MKRIGFLLIALLTLSVGLTAQEYKLTRTQQESLEKAAKEMVKTFQNNCRKIGDTRIPFDKKTGKGGIIEMALEDFLDKDTTNITITSLYGKSSETKPVKKYLYKLAILAKDVYREITITSYDCAMVSGFVRDPNLSKNGEEWYVGEVKVMQRFRAVTRERWIVEDLVEGVTKVYAKTNRIYNRIYNDRGWQPLWIVKLGDITAENIEYCTIGSVTANTGYGETRWQEEDELRLLLEAVSDPKNEVTEPLSDVLKVPLTLHYKAYLLQGTIGYFTRTESGVPCFYTERAQKAYCIPSPEETRILWLILKFFTILPQES